MKIKMQNSRNNDAGINYYWMPQKYGSVLHCSEPSNVVVAVCIHEHSMTQYSAKKACSLVINSDDEYLNKTLLQHYFYPPAMQINTFQN